MRAVAAHAHQLLLVRHAIGGIRDLDDFTTEEEGADALAFGRHHLDAPDVARQRRHGDEVALLDEVDGFEARPGVQSGLTAGLDVLLFHLVECCFPIMPNPSSRAAFFISASLHANSISAIFTRSSGSYAIISSRRSAMIASRPIGSPMMGSGWPVLNPTMRSRSVLWYAVISESARRYGSRAHHVKSGS